MGGVPNFVLAETGTMPPPCVAGAPPARGGWPLGEVSAGTLATCRSSVPATVESPERPTAVRTATANPAVSTRAAA